METAGTIKLWIPSDRLDFHSSVLVGIIGSSVEGLSTAVLTNPGYIGKMAETQVLVQIIGQISTPYYEAVLAGHIRPNQHSQYPKGLVLAAHISRTEKLAVKDSGYDSKKGGYFEERRSEAEQVEMIAKAQVPPFIELAASTFQGLSNRAARRTAVTPPAIDEFVSAASSAYASKALKSTEREHRLIFYTRSNQILEAGTGR